MSFQKAVTQPTTVVVSYWRATEVVLRPVTKEVSATVAGWVDKAAFDAGADPVVTDTRVFTREAVLRHVAAIPGFAADIKAALAKIETAMQTDVDWLGDATHDAADTF